MTMEEKIIATLRKLPPQQQQTMLDFAEFLAEKYVVKEPRKSLLGALQPLNISISKEEIDEARREMWANFPREQFYDKDAK
ncbi:MAG: DUF2281 domain-containing protein [Acidobacteria bacterium]|nr:DUF2281 domain-containing protein [Acidobacteriota bacterium]